MPTPPVPQTVTPRSLAALMSKELFLPPVVINSFRSGSASITARGKGVRSRMPTMTETLQRHDRLVLAGEGLVEHLDLDVFADRGPVGKSHRHVLIVVENGCLRTMRQYAPFS